MELFKSKFAEFKSIFFSEDLLKENEEHANIVTASTMLNLFWILIITWVLTYFKPLFSSSSGNTFLPFLVMMTFFLRPVM